VGKPPSQREKERGRQQRVSREDLARQRQRRQRLYAAIALAALVALVLSTVAVGLSQGDNDDDAATATTATTLFPTTPSTAPGPSLPPVDVSAPPPGESITGETPCPAADGSSPRVTSFENPPPNCLDPDKDYKAIIKTSEGELTALLNTAQAPETVNNFVVLSRYHFYDGVPFFAMIPKTMLVTGDATGDPIGSGGPGYTIPDEIADVGVIYYWGVLGMYHEPGQPDSNGSRFFIGSGENVAAIPPEFTAFGQVTIGDEAVRNIQKAANPDGSPTKDVRIESIEIVEEPRRAESPPS
jgi:cyclophilin family peptidyl-prolyl cis-trans isomerase